MSKLKNWISENIIEITPNEKQVQIEPLPIELRPVASTSNVNVLPVENQFGEVDEKFITHFNELLTTVDATNFGYKGFIDLLNKIKNNQKLSLQEDQQFTTAWITFTTMGATDDSELLLKSAQTYLQILESDKVVFKTNAEEKISSISNPLDQSIAKLTERNKKILDEIAVLQQEISNNNVEITNLNVQFLDQQKKIVKNCNNYDATLVKVSEEVKSNIIKIKTYIK